jgi:hypothetical protein
LDAAKKSRFSLMTAEFTVRYFGSSIAFSFHECRLSLSGLAARTGIPRATAFRLLSTREAARFVELDLGARTTAGHDAALPAHGGRR